MKESRSNISKRLDRMSTASVPVGKVLATEDADREGVATEPLTLASFLRKFSEVGLFASLIGAAFAYHFALPQERVLAISRFVNDFVANRTVEDVVAPHAQFLRDMVPYLEGGAPVLELKATVWLLCGMFVIAGVLIGRIFEKMSGQPVFPVVHETARRPSGWYRRIPPLAIIGFLVWSAISFSPWGWGPRPPEEAIYGTSASVFPSWEGMSGMRGWLAEVLTGRPIGGSYHSLVAFLQVGVGLMLFLAIEELIRTRRLVYKIFGLLLGMGVIVAVGAVLVKVGAPIIADVWIKWGADAYRNDMGGFIGHNAAISSFMVFPILFGITLLLVHGGRMPRWAWVLLVVSLVAMATAMVLAQSRAVVPILFVALAFHLVLLARRALIRPRMGFWLAVPIILGVLVLSQFVDHPYNRLYRSNLPLATRVQHLTGEHLLTETRLRILLASMPVVRENALLGTGFGTFQYHYPAAQGRFYQNNPETRIAPTPRRSFHAHNEYLQTLYETGIVGLGLALAGLLAILWSGWTALRASVRQRHIAIQVALLVSLGAMLTHALFDFPFRVAPLSAVILTLLAIWSSGSRLWVIRVEEMEERDPGAPIDMIKPDKKERSNKNAARVAPWKQFAPHGVVVILGGVTLWVFLAIGTMAGTWYASTHLTNRGMAAINNYATMGPHALSYADEVLDDATRLSPLMGAPLLYRSQVQYMSTQFVAQQQRDRYLAGEVDSPMIPLTGIDRAMEMVNQSMGDVYFHSSYRQRAHLHRIRSVYDPQNYNQHFTQAVDELERAVLMNPGDPDNIMILLAWKRSDPRAREQDDLGYYRLLHRFHRWVYEDVLLPEYLALTTMNERHEAYSIIRPIALANPEVDYYQQWLLSSAIDVNDMDTAVPIIAELKPKGNMPAYVAEALFAARDGNFERAVAILRSWPGRDPELRAFADGTRKMIDAVAAYRSPDNGNFDERIEQLVDSVRGNRAAWRSAALSMANHLDMREEGIALYRRMLEEPGLDFIGADYAALARMLIDSNRSEIDRVRRLRNSTNPDAELSESLRLVLKEVYELYSLALEMHSRPSDQYIRDRIQRHLNEVGALLAEQ